MTILTESELRFFINVFITLGIILLIIIFIYQSKKKNRHAPLLTWAMLLGIIGQIFHVYYFWLESSMMNVPEHVIFWKLGWMWLAGMSFLMYLHFEAISEIRPRTTRFGVACFIFGAYYALSMAFLLNLTDSTLEAIASRYNSIPNMFAFGFAAVTSARTTVLLKERESMFETLALAMVFLGMSSFVIIDNHLPGMIGLLSIEADMETFGDVVNAAGVIILILTYLSNIDYLYRLPVPIHQLILYNSAGLPVYSRRVKTKGFEVLQVENTLFAGGMSAISSLMKEALGSSAILQHIDARHRHLFFQTRKTLTICAVADKGTKFLLQSLKLAVNLIAPQLENQLNHPIISTKNVSDQLDTLFQEAFPYLELLDG